MMNDKTLSKETILSLLTMEENEIFDIHIFDCVSSTNDVVKEMAMQNMKEGTVVIAKEQTLGRGRKGRSFYSPANTGLYMSILLRPVFTPQETTLLTPMTAVVVAEALEEICKKQIDIKWINDLLLNGKKICGILTEASIVSDGSGMEYVIIGIGINLSDPQNGFPLELSDIAGSVQINSSEQINQIVALILRKFKLYYLNFNKNDFFEKYKKRLFFLGKEIDIVSNNRVESATAVDINDSFHLIVKMSDGTFRELDSGEISIKPLF